MRTKKVLQLILSLVVPTVCLSQQIDFDQIQIETTAVADNIYMLSGGGGNIGVLVGDDGILLIDSMFAELEEKTTSAIAALKSGPIQYVLNTNWHYDHVRGNVFFAKSGATIVAHTTTRERMSSEQYHPFFDMKIPAYPKQSLPVITFVDSLTLHINREEVVAFHVPAAHSDADVAFYFRKANVLHTGDLFFSKGYPFIDYNHGGGIEGMIASADMLLARVDEKTKIIPGHGPLSDRDDLERYQKMLMTLRDRIDKQIQEGKSLEEITASKPTSDFDEGRDMGMPPDDFVKIVFEDLTMKSST